MQYIHHMIVQKCQTSHNNNLNHPIITMNPVSAAQHNHILSLLDSGHSGYDISSQTGVSVASISILCSSHHHYIMVTLLSFLSRIYAILFDSLALEKLKIMSVVFMVPLII